MPASKKSYPKISGSFFEQVRDLGSSIVTTAKKDLVGKLAEETLEQVFGTPRKGELKEGQVLNLSKEKKETVAPYFELRREETLLFVKEEDLTHEVEAARAELKKAINELEKLGQEVGEVEKAVEKMPVKPGIYHLTFFERLRQVIKFFSERIEESRTWLHLMISKKNQKKYWALYKRHGTMYGLSGERVVATQTG